jgi:predicted Zn-dependent protease
MKKILAGILVFVSTCSFAGDYQQAVTYIINNKRDSALAVLKQLQVSGDADGKASLLACMIEVSNEHLSEAFRHYQQFHKKSPDPYPYFYALSNTGMFTSWNSPEKNNIEKLLKDIASTPAANSTVKAQAIEKLGNSLMLGNKIMQQKKFTCNWVT